MIGNILKRRGKLIRGGNDEVTKNQRFLKSENHVRFPDELENREVSLFESLDLDDAHNLHDSKELLLHEARIDPVENFEFSDSEYAFEEIRKDENENVFEDPFKGGSKGHFQKMIDHAFQRNLPSSFKSVKTSRPSNENLQDTNPIEIFQNNVKVFKGKLRKTKKPFQRPDVKDGINRMDVKNGIIVTSQRIIDVKNENDVEIINLANKEVENIFDNQKLTESLPNAANNDVGPESVRNEEASNNIHSDIQGNIEEVFETTTFESTTINDIPRDSSKTLIAQTLRPTVENKEVNNGNGNFEVGIEPEIFDDEKIFVKSTSSVENSKKQILWKSEDISATEIQIKPKAKQQSTTRNPPARRLPKHFKKENDDTAPPITVDLPNIDNIANFATVIERNDTEGVVQRTVIIKNSPAAFQAFGIKNVPKNVLSTIQENNDFEKMINRNPKDFFEESQENFDIFKDYEEPTTIRNVVEEPLPLNNKEDFMSIKTQNNMLSSTINEDEEHLSVITTKESSLENKSQQNLRSEFINEPNQLLQDKSFQNFKVIERNDTEGNRKRIVIIKNTPQALKTFGIKNIPKSLITNKKVNEATSKEKLPSSSNIPEQPKTSFHLIDIPSTPVFDLGQELDEVFSQDDHEDESKEVLTNDIFIQNPESSIPTDFDKNPKDLQSIHPLKKLKMHLELESSKSANLDLQTNAEVIALGNGKEESETLKTLFYEDFSHELTEDKNNIVLTSSSEDLITDADFDFSFTPPQIETINIGPVVPNNIYVDNFKLSFNNNENRNPKEFRDEVTKEQKLFEDSLGSGQESNFQSSNQGSNGLVIFPGTTSDNFESPTIDLGLISDIKTIVSNDEDDSSLFIPSTLDHQENNLIKVSPFFQTSATKSENNENHPSILSSLDPSDSLAQFAQEVNLITSDDATFQEQDFNQAQHSVHNFNPNLQEVNQENNFKNVVFPTSNIKSNLNIIDLTSNSGSRQPNTIRSFIAQNSSKDGLIASNINSILFNEISINSPEDSNSGFTSSIINNNNDIILNSNNNFINQNGFTVTEIDSNSENLGINSGFLQIDKNAQNFESNNNIVNIVKPNIDTIFVNSNINSGFPNPDIKSNFENSNINTNFANPISNSNYETSDINTISVNSGINSNLENSNINVINTNSNINSVTSNINNNFLQSDMKSNSAINNINDINIISHLISHNQAVIEDQGIQGENFQSLVPQNQEIQSLFQNLLPQEQGISQNFKSPSPQKLEVSNNIPNHSSQNLEIPKNLQSSSLQNQGFHDKIPSPVTEVPDMQYQSASGRIRMPVTFQYGFEPMTGSTVPLTSSKVSTPVPSKRVNKIVNPTARPREPKRKPLFSPKPFVKPVPIVRKNFKRLEFYQQQTVLDKLSGLLNRVSKSFISIIR